MGKEQILYLNSQIISRQLLKYRWREKSTWSFELKYRRREKSTWSFLLKYRQQEKPAGILN
jgi:hypothetical protein